MDDWRIFGEALGPGEKRRTALKVLMGGLDNQGEVMPGTRAGGDYELPAILINGKHPGKTLLVTAGIHAGEYNGIPAVIQVARELDPQAMAGRVIVLPCVNTSGFWTRHPRTLPEDDFNLNGQYPGKADGTAGERLADFFVREIFPQVDFIMDFHGGSRGERMTPLVFFPTYPKVRKTALDAAKAMNVGFIVESQATRGEYSYAARCLDIPGLLLERGDGYYCRPEWVEADRQDLWLLIEHLGIAKAPDVARDPALKRRVFREAVYLDSEINGLWTPAVDRNMPIQKGQLLGTLTDLYGDLLREIRAEHDGHLLYLDSGLAVRKGGFLVAYGIASSEE